MNRVLLLLSGLLTLPACKGSDDRVDTILALDGDADAGATLFDDNCATCHGADGEGGSGPALAGEEDEGAEIIDKILYGDGDMPAFDGDLEDQDIADIYAFMQQDLLTGEGD